MGLNLRGRILVSEDVIHRCTECKLVFGEDALFCSECGRKLTIEKSKLYANYGNHGVTSLSYVMSDGTTFNTRGRITKNLAKGVSYTVKT